MTEHWAVTVERNGENVVTIESNCLSGRDLSAEDENCIRNCAQHLLAFVGKTPAPDPVRGTPQLEPLTDTEDAEQGVPAVIRRELMDCAASNGRISYPWLLRLYKRGVSDGRGASEAVLSMAVHRLGGMVEGRPTERVNFLQRIDELRRIEAAAPPDPPLVSGKQEEPTR